MDRHLATTMAFCASLMAAGALGQRFSVMTTTRSVAVTWNQSESFTVRIQSKNGTACSVVPDQRPRICVRTGLDPATRHEVTVISEDGAAELYRGTHYTKPLPPRDFKWLESSREYIALEWMYPPQENNPDYIVMLIRESNNLTEYQDLIVSRETVVRRKIWLPSIYGIAYGTAFRVYLWSKYESERSSPVKIYAYSAPRPVSKLLELAENRTNASAAVQWEAPDYGGVTAYKLVIKSRMFAQTQFPTRSNDLSRKNIVVPASSAAYTFYWLTPASAYDVSIWTVYHGMESSIERYTTIYTNPSPVKKIIVSYWTTDAVTLSWIHADPYLPVGFDYVITATSGDHRREERVVGSALSVEVRYLRPGNQYTLEIRVKMATHPYTISDPISTTVQLKPDPVQYVEFNNVTAGTMNVSWTPGRYTQDSYSIRYHGIYVKKYWSRPVTSPRPYVVLRDMFPGETYYVGVTSHSRGESSIEVTNTVTVAPLPPERIWLEDDNVTDTSALVHIVYDATHSANTQWYIAYELWSTGRTSYVTVPASITDVRLWRLTPGRLYTVKAYGRTTGGLQSTDPTEVVTFSTRPVFTSTMTSEVTSRSVTVTYQYASDTFDGYLFTLRPDNVTIYNMRYDKPEVTFHNLLPGTPYTVMMQVKWGRMLSKGKNTTILTKPEPFVECGALQNTSIELLIQNKTGPVDEYLIQCNPGCAYTGDRISEVDGSVQSYTVDDLEPGRRYLYTVRAVRVIGVLTQESKARDVYCSTSNSTTN